MYAAFLNTLTREQARARFPTAQELGQNRYRFEIAQNGGWGYRGGDFYNPELDLRVSARNVATFAGARRLFGLGFRAVKSAP